jgi:drug/metabolite transporter (DMT)-like permease
MGRSASRRGLNAWTTLLYIFIFAAIIMLGVNLVFGHLLPGGARTPIDMFWLGRAWDGWLVIFILAAVPTLLGFGLYNVSLHYLPASVANLVLTVEPVITAVIAYLLFGEMLAGVQILGSGLILCGVFLIRYRQE